MIKWIMIAYLFLAGCATTGKYEAALDTWRGRSVEELVATWGVPTQMITTKSGLAIYEYIREGHSFVTTSYVGGVGYASLQRTWCKTDFITKDDKIFDWRWEGNACRSH